MSGIERRDFSPGAGSPTRNVGFDLNRVPTAPAHELSSSQSIHQVASNSTMPPSPILRRRTTRTNTFRTIDVAPRRPEWHPGQEPGLDPDKPDGGRSTLMLHEECQITVVDFSDDNIVTREFDNEELVDFLEKDQEDWIKCRWININGLSWDVIQAVGKCKKLHKLAIEDMVNVNNRTKADWYTDHTYIVMTLQKLVHLHPDESSDSDCDDDNRSIESVRRPKRGPFRKAFHNMFKRRKSKHDVVGKPDFNLVAGVHDPSNGYVTAHTHGEPGSRVQKLRTLQRYHGGPNQERMAYMETHSPLSQNKLAVSAEQVSIFLTADNTVISFFESSADDIETPILHRLNTADTILRRSCDASMLMQAIIDAIIDLAIPVTFAYQDAIGSLELDVLTNPSIKHTTSLYIVTSEITTLRNFVSPIASLIGSLRDHKNVGREGNHRGDAQKAASTVKISSMAQTYLGDVEDHIVLMTESLDLLRRNADGMIDLIFNTISAYQNESMKQLTIVTIIFLPLSFLTGYFGMNFTDMPSINHNEKYFWMIALPVAFAVICFLMRDMIAWWFKGAVQRRGISRSRKGRMVREANEKRFK